MKLFKQLYLIGLSIYLIIGSLVLLMGYNVYLKYNIDGTRKKTINVPQETVVIKEEQPKKVEEPKKEVKTPVQVVKPTPIVKDTVVVIDTTTTAD